MKKNVNYIRSFSKKFLSSDSERTANAKKNILLMLFYKGGNILIGLLLVPMTINYVDSENYGIWLTLSSMVAWMNFFDIGLNNGLRNKLTEALAIKDFALGKKYVSTTYAMLSLIFIPLMIILVIATPFIHWSTLLNLPLRYEDSLVLALVILVVYFCLNTIFSTINIVMMADQQPADASLRTFIQQAAALLVIFLLTKTTAGNLINLCLALCICPLVIVVIFNFTLFKGKYSKVSPNLSSVDFKVAPDLLKLGVQFFVIQIAGVIQYQMTNFLIMRYFGANSVTQYNIAYKYFSVITMIWGILTTPIWSAVTDAYAKRDYEWICITIIKFFKIFLLFSFFGMIMLSISPLVYKIWIGDKVDIAFMLSAAILLYSLATMFSNIFVFVLNGIGKLKVQTYACLFSPIVYLAVFFLCTEEFKLGIYSVIIAAILANFNGLIFAPIQCYNFLQKKMSKK